MRRDQRPHPRLSRFSHELSIAPLSFALPEATEIHAEAGLTATGGVNLSGTGVTPFFNTTSHASGSITGAATVSLGPEVQVGVGDSSLNLHVSVGSALAFKRSSSICQIDYDGSLGVGVDFFSARGSWDLVKPELRLYNCQPPPVTVTVTNPGAQTGTVGSPSSLQIAATDTDGGALSYAASGLPAGLSIDPTTGLITGTPTGAGGATVTVTATDTSGPSGSATFSWTIGPATASEDSLAGSWLSQSNGATYVFSENGPGSFSGYVVNGGCAATPGDINDTYQGNGYYTGTENTFSSFNPCVIAGTATNTIQISADGTTAEWDSADCSDCGPQTWTREDTDEPSITESPRQTSVSTSSSALSSSAGNAGSRSTSAPRRRSTATFPSPIVNLFSSVS